MSRKDWDDYFLEIAKKVSTRATCDRLSVGCVLVRDKHIIATGYNGSISGQPHCTDVGHMMRDGHCVRTVHAEENSIAMAAKLGHTTKGSIAYVTHNPCWNCYKLLVNSGVTRIVAAELYKPVEYCESVDSIEVEIKETKDV